MCVCEREDQQILQHEVHFTHRNMFKHTKYKHILKCMNTIHTNFIYSHFIRCICSTQISHQPITG